MSVCVAAADSGHVQEILATGTQRCRKLDEIRDMLSPDARLLRRNLVAGSNASVFSGACGGSADSAMARHSVECDAEPHAAEVLRYSKRIARGLDERGLLFRAISRGLSRATPLRIVVAVVPEGQRCAQ